MPLPQRGPKESKKQFMDRCLSDSVVNKEFPDNGQRFRVCQKLSEKSKKSSKAIWDMVEKDYLCTIIPD